MKQSATDFGWRYKGRWVGVYRDLSRDGVPEGETAPVVLLQRASGTLTCLQCGVCTAACHLATDHSVFPRREMSLVQGGLMQQAAQLPTIWQCYQCDDCTDGCPSLAKPSEVMNRLRRVATEAFSPFPAFAAFVNAPKGFALVSALSLVFMGIVAFVAGDLPALAREIRFRSLFPHGVLIPLFGAVAAASVLLTGWGLGKAWQSWTRVSAVEWHTSLGWRALWQVIGEAVLHSRFAVCETAQYRKWAHVFIVAGFVGLAGAALYAAIHPAVSGGTAVASGPLDLFKLVANGFSWLLLAGLGLFFLYRQRKLKNETPVAFSDWLFPLQIAAIVATGFSSQWLRWLDIRSLAYLAYVLHVTAVLVIFITLPFAKPSHALYRMLAEFYRVYLALVREKALGENPLTAQSGRDAAENQSKSSAALQLISLPSLERLPIMAHAELAGLTDAVLIDSYNALRDEWQEVDGQKRYGNIENLYATSFEREKDRRELSRELSNGELSNDEWKSKSSSFEHWYEKAAGESCTWWLANHFPARHSLKSCMFCGMCTAVCPAAEHYAEYNPRTIVDVALSGDEQQIEQLLKTDIIWYCGQCGSCKERCSRGNSVMGLISSLRILAQLKGWHLFSTRGRQQYASRFLWGSNFWNRGCSLYFRNADKWNHPDFGPGYERFYDHHEQEFLRLGANPDREGIFGGRKIHPQTLRELRLLTKAGGTLTLWNRIQAFGDEHRRHLRMTEEAYLQMVAKEG